jgi:hypothetical protein
VTREDAIAQAESQLAARGAETLVLLTRPAMDRRRTSVRRSGADALLIGPWGERVILDRFHVELAALALGCKLVDADPAHPKRARHCCACARAMGVMTDAQFRDLGTLCSECGGRTAESRS